MESFTWGKAKWLVVAVLFGLCVAPTFISYRPWVFTWDDSDYLSRSIEVSRAFYSWSVHQLGVAMVSMRPPAMTFLGLPWGPLASWDAASNCFLTLAAATSLLAALCFYLVLRIGVKPLFSILAGLCVFASMGPYPVEGASAHSAATGFLADSLFAWTTLAAVLLLPFEARSPCPSGRSAVMRGVLWGLVLSLGAMTKVNFLYFVVTIVPALFLIGFLQGGLPRAVRSVTAFFCVSAPSAFYLVHYGRAAFDNARASSFGGVATFYRIPVATFLGDTFRESPGMLFSFLLTACALIYVVCVAVRRRRMQPWPDLLAVLIVIGFGIIVLAAPNKQIRYAFPAIVALPFLTGILLSGKGDPVPARTAASAAVVVLCALLAASVPTRHRADRRSLDRCEAVLAEALRCNAKSIVIATDSPTMNNSLLGLAMEFSPSRASNVTLAYRAMSGVPVAEDFRAMGESDLVVFQDREALRPAFTNQRVPEYEEHIRQTGVVPVRVANDVLVYPMHCRP